jgi:dTDP-4-amino-4,6-dideoxygalactose transaminase
MDDIRIFDLSYSPSEREAFKDLCGRILQEGYLTNHTYVRRFEQLFSQWKKSRHAIAVNNCTSALYALMMAENVEGREVLLPTNTFFAAWEAVVKARGIPVLVDIEPRFLGPCLSQLEESLSRKTAAVLTVHIGGIISPEIHELAKWSKQAGIRLFEDCAHAHFSELDGVPAGLFGDAGAFSFHLTKVMTTGEGGMIITNQSEIADTLRSLREFGRSPENPHQFSQMGTNLKMTEFQGALGCLEFERARLRHKRRGDIALLYQSRLLGSPWEPVLPPPQSIGSFYKMILRSPLPRQTVTEFCRKKNISLTNGVYFIPLHQQPVVRRYGVRGEFPQADHFCTSHICPPCYPELDDDAIHRVCDALLELAP